MPEYEETYKPVLISEIKQEKKDVKSFTITPEDGQPISYLSGQFLTFVFYHHQREERRSFSISSSPVVDEPLSFTIKRVENGAYSRYFIDKAKVGDRLYTTGAAGLFTLPEEYASFRQIFFFAAGIGITPIYSLIKTLLHTRPDLDVVLVYSNRNIDEVVFYDELQTLALTFKSRFRIEYLFSTAFDLSRARLNKLLLPILINEYATVEKEKMLFYTCGPFVYMRMVIITLEELGISSSQIKKENFNTEDRTIKKIEPPDKDTHNVLLKWNGKEYHFTSQYPDTILRSAKKNNIALPYSCEIGRCGSCVATCTKGNVWISYNEVLMESDIAKGKVLTCVGYPVNGDIVLEL
ncbi:MAG TPA: iron-sulfur cluster-binding domain-containing protein [Flavipsychrobacter sp.]|nr:iron-sulfur cluster-binding domain-containing protein [Flavipsychrobacter sp.]